MQTLNYVVFNVKIAENITGGTVTADPTIAAEGDSINLRAISNAGYKLTSLMINGESVTLIAEDYYGTFSMPDHDVIVTAEFAPMEYKVYYALIGGSGSVSGLDAAKTGDMVELNVSPAEGYLLQSIDVYNYSTHNSFEVKPDANGKYSFTMPAGNVQVQYGFRKAYTVTLAGSDHGTVTFAEGYASLFMAGSTVCLTIAPEEGYVLDTVTVKGDNGGTYTFDYNNKSFQMPEENVTVTVKFKPEAPVFTVTNGNDIELHEGDTFHPNDKLTVTYISGTGTITNCEWFLDDVSIRTGTECSFYSRTYPTSGTVKITARNDLGGETTLTLNYVVFAVKIDKNITGGTVTANWTSAAEGETVVLTATPNDGYQFVSMTVDGEIVEANASGYYELTMPAKDVTVTATFEARTYTVGYAFVSGDAEYGSVSGQNSAKIEDTVELTVSSAEGYRIQEIVVYNCRTEEKFEVKPDQNGKYSFTMPGDHVQVQYIFEKVYTVTLADSNHGMVTFAKDSTSPFTAGSAVCLTITPDEGYELDTVTVKGDNGGKYTFDSATNSFQMPTENVTVTAMFKVKVTIEPVLTVTRNGVEITDTSNIYEGDELKASFTGVEGEVTYWWYVEKEVDGEYTAVTLSETDSYTVSAVDMEGVDMGLLILSVDYPGDWMGWNLYYSDEAPQSTPTVTRNGVELSEGEYVSPGDVLIAQYPGAVGFMWTCNGQYVAIDATCTVPQGLEDGSWLYLEAYDEDGFLEPIGFQYKVRYNVTIAPPVHGTVTAEKYAGYEGDVIRLSLTPEQGYVLSSLTVDGQSIIVYEETSKHEFRMPDHNVTVTATFKPMTYGIAYMQAGSPLTWGTVTGPDGATEGEKVKLTVTPADGYQLERLYVDIDSGEHDVKADENGEYSFIMPAEFVHIRFAFAAIYTVTIDEAITGGKVTADKTAAFQGETVTLTVTPAEGYELDELTVMQGKTEITVTNNQFTMPDGDVTVKATFKADVITEPTYTVTIANQDGETVEDGDTVNVGDTLTVSVAPDTPYREWLVNGEYAGENTLTVSKPGTIQLCIYSNDEDFQSSSNPVKTVTLTAVGGPTLTVTRGGELLDEMDEIYPGDELVAS